MKLCDEHTINHLKTTNSVIRRNNQQILTQPIANKSKYFEREIFTMRSFIQHLKLIRTQRKSMKQIFREKIITKKFVERIMLTSSVLNGCIYCQ